MRNSILKFFYVSFLVIITGCASFQKQQNISFQERSNKLLLAAFVGDDETVKEMLDNGISIGIKDKFLDSPLHLAIKGKNLSTVTLLISRGADVNQKNALGDTPLHISIYTKQKEITTLLRSKGALDGILNQYGIDPNEMESLPDVEAAITEVVALLSSKGEWINIQKARPLFFKLKQQKQKFLVNALVLRIIRSPSVRPQAIALSVKLGIPESEEKLGAIIMVFGNTKMAEDYLNSGSSILHQWAIKWANANGYYIKPVPGTSRIRWGQF